MIRKSFLARLLRQGGWLCVLFLAFAPALYAQNPPTAQAEIEAGEFYRDQLIDPDIEPLPPAEALVSQEAGLPWLFGASYRFGTRELDGSQTREHALALTYQLDTANFGLIRFEGIARRNEAGNNLLVADEGAHGQFTLTQTALPLGGGWFADNGLGVQRSASDPLIEASYRIYLPSSFINGFTTRIRDADEEWRFTWGETGRLEGLQTRTFESDDTRLLGAGYSRQIGDQWRLAAEFWQADPEEAEKTQNLTAALEFAPPGSERTDRIHLLTDNDGDTGLWYDGRRSGGNWIHRFGGYTLAEGLQWQDVPILNNRDGLYYRGDYNTLTANYTIGVDAIRRRDHDLLSYRLFAGASWRLSADARIGGQLSAGAGELFEPPAGTHRHHDIQANVFYNHRLDWFDQRIEYQYQRSEDGASQSSQRLRLDQFWHPGRLEGLATSLEFVRINQGGEVNREMRLGLNYRYRFANDVSVDAGLQWVRTDPHDTGAGYSANASLALDWPINRHWSLGVNATYTESHVPVIFAAGSDGEIRGNQVFFNLSYSAFGGRPTRVVGAGTADAGVGRLTGVVYYDENADGRRSPGERGATGIIVRLDGLVTAVTDAQGRYEFWPVAAGTHRLEVNETSVPLPWTPVQPLPVAVAPRGVTYRDLPLQRINE